MNSSSTLALIHNAALLLAMIFIYDLSTRYWRAERGKFWGWQLPAGVALGAITVVIMLTPWIYQPGIIFDTRTILLSITGLFFGAVPTVIAMIIAAAFRIYTGGFAVVTGVLTIVSAGLIGIIWRSLRTGDLANIRRRELVLFGLLVHVVMILLMFTMPWNLAFGIITTVALPVLILYPLVTTLMGRLLADRLLRESLTDNLAVSEEIIWQKTNFDPLTKLPNRLMLLDHLGQEIKKSICSKQPVALLLLDLDSFKEINDTLGHATGDCLLQQTAARLLNCVRDTDIVARLGGDEFTVILPNLKDQHRVEQVAEKILRELSQPFLLNDETTYISASIGIALYPEDASSIEELLKHADQAMYAAKDSGRNRYHYFTPAMQEVAQNRMRLISDLRTALVEQQFLVYYQPIIELKTGLIGKAEALVRWQHPQRGLVPPGDFIPIAEETGIINELGNWVFYQAVNQIVQWRDWHNIDIQISVNKSPAQFRDETAASSPWIEHLQNLKLPAGAITIEITEGLLLDAHQAIRQRLLAFHDAGMQVALDDFGTGYSSLSYLQKFEIDYLKIDQSFIRNLSADSDELALCEAIIVMAHKLNIKVVAEGVETELQRKLLLDAGCDYAQGYLFSRPIPADEFARLFLTH
jgi:diguanylate cyclase (GGDEF)-like protein